MNFLRTAWIACLCLSMALAQQPTVSTPLTNERIVELARSGVQQDQLRQTILSAPQVDFHLTPEAEEIMLKAGVTEETIKAMSALSRARFEGKQLGRPRAVVDRGKLVSMRQSGMSIRQISKAVHKSPMTVQRLLKRLTAEAILECAA